MHTTIICFCCFPILPTLYIWLNINSMSSFIILQYFLKNSIPMPSCSAFCLRPLYAPLFVLPLQGWAYLRCHPIPPPSLYVLRSSSVQRTRHTLVSVRISVSYVTLWSFAGFRSRPGCRGSFEPLAVSVSVLDGIVTDALPEILLGLLHLWLLPAAVCCAA